MRATWTIVGEDGVETTHESNHGHAFIGRPGDSDYRPLGQPEGTIQPAPRMSPCDHYCEYCDAEYFPEFPWQGEGHVGVRFDRGRGFPDRPLIAVVDGTDVWRCAELLDGRFGWAISVIGDWREAVCPRCRNGVLFRVHYGEVSVRFKDKT